MMYFFQWPYNMDLHPHTCTQEDTNTQTLIKHHSWRDSGVNRLMPTLLNRCHIQHNVIYTKSMTLSDEIYLIIFYCNYKHV